MISKLKGKMGALPADAEGAASAFRFFCYPVAKNKPSAILFCFLEREPTRVPLGKVDIVQRPILRLQLCPLLAILS